MNYDTLGQEPNTPRGESRKVKTISSPSKPNPEGTCKKCGYRIRSDNHENGPHHNGRVHKK